MALKLRLKRKGKKHAPTYDIIVTDSRNARDGRFIERLGYYNPIPQLSTIEFNLERVLHWYKIGARPSDSFAALLKAKKVNLSDLAKTSTK